MMLSCSSAMLLAVLAWDNTPSESTGRICGICRRFSKYKKTQQSGYESLRLDMSLRVSLKTEKEIN